MSKTTPGPWRVDKESLTDGSFIYNVMYDDGMVADLLEANREGKHLGRIAHDARLISAAPDLLAACEAAADELREFMPTTAGDTVTKLEAAIAKARGTALDATKPTGRTP